MERNSRIFVAGHRGLAVSAIVRALRAAGYDNLLPFGDAMHSTSVYARTWIALCGQSSRICVHGCRQVGGILANSTYPADFLYDILRSS